MLILSAPALSLDTDIYAINPRPNVAIQFDTSGSMGAGLYENGVNYKQVYASACEQTDGGYTAYDKNDTAKSGGGTKNPYYKKFIDPEDPLYTEFDLDEIVLLKGSPGLSVSDDKMTMVGDTGHPEHYWDYDNIIRTNTKLVAGKLVTIDPGLDARLTVDEVDQTIYLDEKPLPLDRNITLNNIKDYEDGTTINLGFAGTMEAPGLYFTGYDCTNSGAGNLHIASDDETYIYFLAKMNRVFMMMAYQLFTEAYDPGWGFYGCLEKSVLLNHKIPLLEDEIWTDVTLKQPIISPNYPAQYKDRDKAVKLGTITQPGAIKIKLHFVELDLYTDNNDIIKIKDLENKDLLGKITSSSNDSSSFYSAEYSLTGTSKRGLIIKFITDGADTVSKGFKIDGYSYSSTSSSGGYTMKTRLDAVREAILFVIDDTRGDINWALSGFNDGDGADIRQPFNPEHANDDATRQNIIEQLEKFVAEGGTPLGESMQDIFNHFHKKQKDFNICSRQFAILISDGFPSVDTDWDRLDSNVTMEDFDGDSWTADPSQNTDPNYLDDVTHYMYTHVFRNSGFGDEIDDPANSFDNITTHTLSFAMDLPLLTDAAEDGGGVALVANSSQQMVNALRSLAMLAIKSASYVAPVISVDTANKTQSGEWLYMAFFKPTSGRWVGNLKKYKLVRKQKDGDCPGRTKEEWVVTDTGGDESDALDCDGQFLDDSKSYWSSVIDGGEVTEGGVGEKLRAKVKASFENKTYYSGRNIYVLKNEVDDSFPNPVAFNPTNISNEDLGVADDLERYKLINYIHGYTYTADATTYAPAAYRNWPLGSFIHSNPNLITYETVTDGKTYIIIGSNDGMIHVFDDTNGDEVIAFIPEDLLPRLKEMNPDKAATGYKDSPLFYIDGQTSYYQTFSNEGKSEPKQLIFGLRRGGSSYYSLNVENSDPSQWTLKWHLYDDSDKFTEMGESWSKIELMPIRIKDGVNTKITVAGVLGAGYDPEYDDTSTIKSSNGDKPGAALYVIDILASDASGVSLLKKVGYKLQDGDETVYMHYAIPANPAVVPNKYGRLKTIYFTDLGGQLWNLDYDTEKFTFATKPRLVFSANPGSNANSGDKNGGSIVGSKDTGRRMFYSPTITLMGGCNYRYSSKEACDYKDLDKNGGTGSEACGWKTRDSDTYALVVGTGDRVNPNRQDVNNRIYMILDTNEDEPLDETNLFNVTMDDIDIDNTDITELEKTSMRNYLSTTNGWYIKLEDINDSYQHDGEKILAHPLIFNGAAYVPSFTPITDDVCLPKGEAKIFALHYCDGTAAVNFFKGNDYTSGGDDPVAKFDYRDRYKTIGESLPSSPKVIIREGKAEIFISVGGGLPTIESKLGLKPIEVINWRELRN